MCVILYNVYVYNITIPNNLYVYKGYNTVQYCTKLCVILCLHSSDRAFLAFIVAKKVWGPGEDGHRGAASFGNGASSFSVIVSSRFLALSADIEVRRSYHH